ncbi:Crp/Fnr family transcriptional regulator [Thermus thermamylovorans]|uniref:Crp/Fnr family transcriptional regulator n=1 Tax=Thermus thermamylovorans TaxID=2509362 RepID=A0A4Q9B6J8_9DEIN|nr:Crp/Fnr family transcriptional regulator [Thermus thermamylovorans]TBH21327.1 Crp/Fnr family transcriptional regulator [Thermus thermamylovorans]
MSGSPLFLDLNLEEARLARSYFTPLAYPRGKPIFHQGDLGQSLYLVEWGRVRLYRTHLGGQEKTLGFLGPGGVFGEMSLLDASERSASAVAEEDTLLLALYREPYLGLIRRLPLVAHNLARILAHRLREANLELDLLAFEEAQSRVAYALLKLLRQGYGPRLRLRHQDLAALAGASRETVTRVLHQLKDQGVLRLAPGEVEVADAKLLEEVAFGLA